MVELSDALNNNGAPLRHIADGKIIGGGNGIFGVSDEIIDILLTDVDVEKDAEPTETKSLIN